MNIFELAEKQIKQALIDILDDVHMGKYGSQGLNMAADDILKIIKVN